MGQKQSFLNLLKNLIINLYRTWFIMKIYGICLVHAQILFLEKILVLRYNPKMLSAIQILWFLNHFFLQSISMKQPHCLQIDINSQSLKVDRKFFWLSILKNKRGQSGLRILKLNLSQKRTDGTNQLFAGKYKFTHMKRWLKFLGVTLWLVWSRDSKIDWIWRMDRKNKLIFCMVVQIQKS